MVSFCREEKIDLIINKSISRFSRNITIALSTVRELIGIGVGLRFEKENINTLLGGGEFMLTALSSFAQEESKNGSDNIKWKEKRKFMQGELVINREKTEIVTRIFNDYIEGKGITTIEKSK